MPVPDDKQVSFICEVKNDSYLNFLDLIKVFPNPRDLRQAVKAAAILNLSIYDELEGKKIDEEKFAHKFYSCFSSEEKYLKFEKLLEKWEKEYVDSE